MLRLYFRPTKIFQLICKAKNVMFLFFYLSLFAMCTWSNRWTHVLGNSVKCVKQQVLELCLTFKTNSVANRIVF